ncbi:MAG: HpsJ family protein [Xenococcaceae cyanobacterium]
MNSSAMSSFTSLSLKLLGVIIIISSLLDFIVIPIPYQPLDAQWQIRFTVQIVERGIVPMVGMAFLLVGYWIDSNVGSGGAAQKPSFLNLRLPMFVLASFLGLIFLLLVPLHLNNLRVASTNALEQIEQRANQEENAIQAFLDQLDTLSQDPQRLNQAIQQRNQIIESGQSQGRQLNAQQLQIFRQQRDQLEQLRDLAKKPEELEARLDELQNQLQTRQRDQKLERENLAKTQALKQGLRIGLSSLMLAIGYITIGWLGLKEMGGSQTSGRRASMR